jgi:predicted ATPase
VQQLVREQLPAGVSLRDLGEHRLRDLLEPERVFQVVHPDLPVDFPPLASLDARPHNLPRQPTPFLGREREIAEVAALLHRDDAQLLTLTGPGGAGKTRLAFQVAAELLDHFADGVFVVSLAALTDSVLVPAAIATALGLREEGERLLTERLADFLATKQLLLVLDNVEHLVEAAPDIGRLLETCAGLKVLATSRVPLHLRAEREYPVPPLGLPRRSPPPSLEQLSQYDAVRLFIDRAQAVKPGFAVDNDNAPAVAEICYRLDGLPLAIELAAARIRMLSPQNILARLEKRLPLLTGGPRDAPARQQTLRATIAWSHDLLSPAERTLFRRLAVFAGGWTVDAAEAVANAHGTLEIFADLERLVEQNLVRPGEEQPNQEPRFTMLETIREYASEQLEASGEADAIRQAHASYFSAMASQLREKARGPEQGALLERVETEHDNLRAALTWLTEHDAAAALDFTQGIFWLWLHHSHLGEARRSLERVLARREGAGTLPYAQVLNLAGKFASDQRDYEQSEAYSRQSLALLQQLGDTESLPYTLLVLGWTVSMRGRRDEAEQLLEKAVAMCRANGDDWGRATALGNLVQIVEERRDYPRAEQLAEERLALFRNLGDQLGVAQSLSSLGWIALVQGDDTRARAFYEESLQGEASRARQNYTLGSRAGLGILAHRAGDLERAEALLHDVLDLAREFEDSFALAFSLACLGNVARDQGRVAQSASYYCQCLTAAEADRDEQGSPDILEALAGLAVDAGQFDLAARLFGQAEAQRTSSGLHRLPLTEPDYARDVQAARDHLGDAEFERALAAGRDLPRGNDLTTALQVAALLTEAAEQRAPAS